MVVKSAEQHGMNEGKAATFRYIEMNLRRD